jgi:putative transposase
LVSWYDQKMERGVALMEGEIYHVFNRGAHKQPIFLVDPDYRRFQVLLRLCNSREKVDAGNTLTKYQGPSLVKLFGLERCKDQLVDILAYALMPNHFHLVLRQRAEGGISQFMRKLCTGYSMYFNLKNGHSGTLFQGRFKSSHVDAAPYLFWIFAYVHLNPIALIAPEWEEKRIDDVLKAQKFLASYPYSSFIDYYAGSRPERSILDHENTRSLIESKKDINSLIASYHRDRVMYRDQNTI